MTPQIVLLFLIAVDLGAVLVLHGKPKDEKHNFFMRLFDKLILIALLYWGGFFDVFKQ